MTIAVLFPLLWMVILSVTPRQYAFKTFIPPSLTLSYYASSLTDVNILMSYRNSWIIATGVVILTLALGAPAAYALSRYKFKLRNHVTVLMVITQMLPVTLMATAYFRLIPSLGLYNSVFALILVDGIDALPFSVLLLKATFDTIPRELEEVAMLDGCSPGRTFVRIILPLAGPGIFAAGFFAFEAAWIEFLYGLTLTSNSVARPLTVEIADRLGHYVINWGQMMAMSFGLCLPVFAVFLFFQNGLLRGFTAGALKE
jgi:multiple sugar transport system permease protein